MQNLIHLNSTDIKKFGVYSATIISFLESNIKFNIEMERNYIDGRHWAYAPNSRIMRVLPFFSEYRIKKIFKKLIDEKVILIRRFNDENWYSFVDEKERDFPFYPSPVFLKR